MNNNLYAYTVFLLDFAMSSFILYMAYKYLTGKDVINWIGKEKPIASKVLGVILIPWAIWYSADLTVDIIKSDTTTAEVQVVKQYRTGFPSGIISSLVLTENHGQFRNMYHKFNLKVPGKYRIKYLTKSKVIIETQKIDQ